MRLLQYRFKYRCKLAGRGVDDLQHLGGRSLLFQRLARFGQEPRAFYCDDRLRREVFEQRDLLVAERADLLAVNDDCADQCTILAQRHRDKRPGTGEVRDGATVWVTRTVSVSVRY